MKKIFKYPLTTEFVQVIELPLESEILSVHEQKGKIVVYAIVDDEVESKSKHSFLVYQTGFHINHNDHKFLGTVNLFDGLIMLHVFYKRIS